MSAKPKSKKVSTFQYDTYFIQKDMELTVGLPQNEDYNEWLAFHVVEFYHELSMLCKIIRPNICTKNKCPIMSASHKTQYFWQDNNHYKQPKIVSAPEYIDFLMEYVENIINDQNVFPIDVDITNEYNKNNNNNKYFGKGFLSLAKKLMRRMGRVYGHIYFKHYSSLCQLHISTDVNTCFKHFIYFNLKHNLISRKELMTFGDIVTQLAPTLFVSSNSTHTTTQMEMNGQQLEGNDSILQTSPRYGSNAKNREHYTL